MNLFSYYCIITPVIYGIQTLWLLSGLFGSASQIGIIAQLISSVRTLYMYMYMFMYMYMYMYGIPSTNAKLTWLSQYMTTKPIH